MRIFSASFLALFSLASIAWADAGDISRFIAERNGGDMLSHLEGGAMGSSPCFQTPSHFICIRSGKYPNVASNPTARTAVMRGLATQTKLALYDYAAKKYEARNFSDKAGARAAYLNGVRRDDENFSLKGIEYQTYCQNDNCYAAASIPVSRVDGPLQAKYGQPFFVGEYCKHMIAVAERCIGERKFKSALAIIKELHDLKFANIDAYLRAATAFLSNGQAADAKRMASEIWTDFANQLDAKQAEELGNIFFSLDQKKEAEEAYNLAIEKLSS